LNEYYAQLYVLLGKDSGANRQVADVQGDVSLLRQAIARMPHTVALYTLVGPDRTSLILVTPAVTIARESIISSADLTSKVVLFGRALRDPGGDPRTIAHEVYEILVGPVKSDLDDAKAETIIWSLDGVLRYLPMSALYDGKRYLVESYNTATITPASIAHLADKPEISHMDAVAMGISRKYEPALSALPSVPGELHDVVHDAVADASLQGAPGVLPGTILLDEQFTEKAMERQLGTQHAVLHIASHFVFRPGDASQSYLLLAGKDEPGAGFHLTVADFRDNQNLQMEDTELLTLSACDTGITGNASNGREVDGLGTTAQLKGARSVISSLWGVNDASTGLLMSDFYRRWATGGGHVTKVSALRDAQLDLLLGRMGAAADGRTSEADAPVDGASKMDYSHPYFWAPFVLSGNVQ
jgi:CHAT domain-containing protein